MTMGAQPPIMRYPTGGQVVLLVLICMVLQAATGGTAFTIADLALGDVDSSFQVLRNVWVLIPVIAIANALTLALGLRAAKERPLSFLRVRAFLPGLLPAVILTSVGLAIVLSETDNCLQQLIMRVTGSDTAAADWIDWSTAPFGAAILLVLVAPLTEEYLFRGLILRGLLTRHRPAMAIVLSAVAFAVMHLNLRQGFLALIVGLTFGWWYARTRSVGPSLIGHALFNAVAWNAAQMPDLSAALGLFHGEGSGGHAPWWFTLGGVAFVIIGLRSFHRRARVIGTDPSPPTLPIAEPPLLTQPALVTEPPFLGPP